MSGVEAHVVVRDLFTTTAEQQSLRAGLIAKDTLSDSAAVVDAVINTIGFPLVGGPAGSMEVRGSTHVLVSFFHCKISCRFLCKD